MGGADRGQTLRAAGVKRSKNRSRHRAQAAAAAEAGWRRGAAALAALLLTALVLAVLRSPRAGAEAGRPAAASGLRAVSATGAAGQALMDGDDAGELVASAGLLCCEYEVWGKVQHVYMRKFTKQKADQLGVTGYVLNTEAKTVRGEACGTPDALASFKGWLESTGAPKARIERAQFGNERPVPTSPFSAFEVRKVKLANGKQWAD